MSTQPINIAGEKLQKMGNAIHAIALVLQENLSNADSGGEALSDFTLGGLFYALELLGGEVEKQGEQLNNDSEGES